MRLSFIGKGHGGEPLLSTRLPVFLLFLSSYIDRSVGIDAMHLLKAVIFERPAFGNIHLCSRKPAFGMRLKMTQDAQK